MTRVCNFPTALRYTHEGGPREHSKGDHTPVWRNPARVFMQEPHKPVANSEHIAPTFQEPSEHHGRAEEVTYLRRAA